MERGSGGGFLEPFESVGITPPRGRQGHSVPTPRPLLGSKLVHVAGSIQDRGGDVLPALPTLDPPLFPPTKVYPAQFSTRRDHFLGGSVSRLDRIRAHNQELAAAMKSFAELEEEGGREDEIRGDYTDYNNSELWSCITSPSPCHYTLEKFTGDSLLHFSFNHGGNIGGDPLLGGSFVRAFTIGQGLLHKSLNVPSVHQMQSSTTNEASSSSTLFPTAARNPNKAIVTIDAQSSRILMTNEITCELFGYQRGDLVGMKVQNLFTEPYRAKQHALVERNIDAAGKEVLVSGKVMDAVTSYGVEFPVSVWMKKISVSASSMRVIVVMEPVERTSACFSLDHKGVVVSCDPWFASLFGYPNTVAVMGQSIFTLIPSLSLPHTLQNMTDQMPERQAVTGRTGDNTAFPLTVQFTNLSQNLSLGDLYSPPPTSPPPLTTSHTSPHSTPHKDHTPHSPNLGETPVDLPETPPPSKSASEDSNMDYIIAMSGETPRVSINIISPNKGETPTLIETPSTNDISPTKGEIPSPNDISPTKGETPLMMNSIGSPVGRVEPPVPPYVDAKVIVYAALSGMVSFLPDGTIHGCNHHFSLMLTGYSQDELLKRDITFLIPEFYSHVGYVDDQGMPLPPLDEGSDDISFQSVDDHSLSPDSAFDYLSSRAHVPPSPVRRKNHEVQRSPVRKPNHHGQSPAHSHHHQPLTSGGPSTSHHATVNVSPRHQIMRGADKNIPGGFSGGHGTMPTLLEEEEEREAGGEKRTNEMKSGRESEKKEVGGGCEGRAAGLDEEEEGEREGEGQEREGEQNEEEERGEGEREEEERGEGEREEEERGEGEREEGEREEGERGEGEERNEEEDQNADEGETESQYPISSTPASKTPDSLLVKTDSFSEYLRAAAAVPGGAAGESDGISVSSAVSLPEGLFQGFIRHKDGSSIAVAFQLKCIPLAGNQSLFCVWLCRDMDRDWTMNRDPNQDPYWTDQVGVSPDVTEDVDTVQDSHQHSMGSALAVAGVYRSCYDTLRPVGQGAFGFVRLAQRKSDKQLVVVKFLRKNGVLKDCWVHDRDMGLVAQEISILARLNHPNIVMLLEAYENEYYFQLVMEKHGDGLDLFEFIERCPKITEPLVSYMFRQVVAGLSYLHGKNILHRDVKDENIIMDQHFHMKLIDLGSAAYMEQGKLFHTFCGTLEYCSPEVLLGNSYPGPELEMWALGVTLYTLVFGESPFFDVEETISGHLQPPYFTSPGLMKVFLWLLHPDPKSRATLKDLERDRWTNQEVDISQYSFESVLGCAVARPTDDKMFHSPKPHPHKDKPHPLSDDIHDIDHLLDTKLHLDSDSSFHSDRGD